MRQKITVLIHGKRISRLIIDSQLNFTGSKDEWTGITINLDIAEVGDQMKTLFTHIV